MGKTKRRLSKRGQQALAKGPVKEGPRLLRPKKQKNENMDGGRDATPVLARNRFDGILSDDEPSEPGKHATPLAPVDMVVPREPRSAAVKQKLSQSVRRAAKKKLLAAAQAAAPGTTESAAAPAAPGTMESAAAPVAPGTTESAAAATAAECPAPAPQAPIDALLARKPSAQGAVLNLANGVVGEVLRAAPADARVAMPGDAVKLTYSGRLATAKKGRTFDKGEVDFLLGDGGMSNGSMIRGFDVGVVGMAVSERRLLRIPWKMGYGKKGNKPKVPPQADLIFDVVLNHAGVEWSNQAKSSMSNKRREKARRIGKKHKIK